MALRTVLLVMYRKIVAQSWLLLLKNDGRVCSYAEYSYENAVLTAEACGAQTVVVEIPESGPVSTKSCIDICRSLKKKDSKTKVLLLCCENSVEAKNAAISAQRNKIIDDFLFFDTSWDYLMSKLEATL